MKHLTLAAALFLAACATAPAQAQSSGCPPAGYDRAALAALKASEWAIADDRARNSFARALVSCLASPDPTLRDGIAFEGLSHLMRAGQLSRETLAWLNTDLQARLGAPDAQGFERPFAALVLSEVARTDRVAPWMSEAERAQLVEASTTYLAGVRDYRGFDEREGWRHGVAHAADIMLQIGLNEAYDAAAQRRVLAAIAAQVSPEGHSYVYGESDRLARAIIFMAPNNRLDAAEWTAWFEQFAPADTASLFSSESGLAARHNTRAFLASVIISARLTRGEADDELLLAPAEAAFRAWP